MDVALIEMPAEVAAEELKSYRRALHRRVDAEYQEVAIGLEQLAKGTPLLQLSRVFSDVAIDDEGRPRLAIARADRLRVQFSAWGGEFRFNSAYETRRGKTPRDSYITIPSPVVLNHARTGYAIVPMTPPDVRGTLDMTRHFVLWEVERWADNARDVAPDVDPFLLQRISADLYAVVGSWDLTPIEQAILAGRRGR